MNQTVQLYQRDHSLVFLDWKPVCKSLLEIKKQQHKNLARHKNVAQYEKKKQRWCLQCIFCMYEYNCLALFVFLMGFNAKKKPIYRLECHLDSIMISFLDLTSSSLDKKKQEIAVVVNFIR